VLADDGLDGGASRRRGDAEVGELSRIYARIDAALVGSASGISVSHTELTQALMQVWFPESY